MPTTKNAWAAQAAALRDWAVERMIQRDDCRGGYYRDNLTGITKITRKKTHKNWTPNPDALLKHFAASTPEDIVGLHSTSKNNTSKWLAFDIDAHTENASADINLKCAIEIVSRLENYRLTGHIFSSDGGGGFHVWVFFDEPQPTGAVFALAKAVTSGMPKVETFPKQAGIDPENGYGNWIRLPGRHHKNDHWHKLWTGEGWADDAGTVDAILRMEGETPANMPEAVPFMVAETGTKIEEPFGPGMKLRLSNKTLLILNDGADSGERNNALAAAAIELAGNGYTKADAEERIVLAASRCRPPLPEDEARQVVASAFSKPRSPYTPPIEELIQSSPATPEVEPTNRYKPTITNILSAKGDENERITIGKTMAEIAEDMSKALGGWPRRVSGMLFVTKPQNGLPTMGAVQSLRKQEQLFSWLHTQADVFWPTAIRKGLYSRNQDPISAVTRTEFFEHLSANAKPDYAAVELLPHSPPFADTFYLPAELPEPTGKVFWEFVDLLNAAKDADENPAGGTFDPGLDRLLMAAALLTPGWGGSPGQRPAFLFSSKYGRGSGKSKTAIAIMRVWGSWVTLQPEKEDWKEAKSRLMDALTSRSVFIDNIRNRLSGAELESLITSPMIDAKKMYVGHFTRPNRLTFFLTSNTPRLSNDLTERSIPIHVGPPQWGKNFDRVIEEFLAKHRAQLLADIFGILAMEPLCEISPENRDRWGSWQDAILTRFKLGNEMAALIKARRPEADADLDDQEELRAAIEAEIQAMHCGDVTYQITSDKLLEIMRKNKLIEEKYGVKGMVQIVGGMLGEAGPLKRLVRNQNRVNGKRGWLYLSTDPACKKSVEIVVQTT